MLLVRIGPLSVFQNSKITWSKGILAGWLGTSSEPNWVYYLSISREFTFAHGRVTSMSLVGSLMALTHSLTHSILINLFIKLELSNSHLPPLLSIVFVQECSVVLRKVWWGETGEAYIFVENLGKSLSSASKIEVVHYGFHVVLFRKYVVFLTIGFCSHIDESW